MFEIASNYSAAEMLFFASASMQAPAVRRCANDLCPNAWSAAQPLPITTRMFWVIRVTMCPYTHKLLFESRSTVSLTDVKRTQTESHCLFGSAWPLRYIQNPYLRSDVMLGVGERSRRKIKPLELCVWTMKPDVPDLSMAKSCKRAGIRQIFDQF